MGISFIRFGNFLLWIKNILYVLGVLFFSFFYDHNSEVCGFFKITFPCFDCVSFPRPNSSTSSSSPTYCFLYDPSYWGGSPLVFLFGVLHFLFLALFQFEFLECQPTLVSEAKFLQIEGNAIGLHGVARGLQVFELKNSANKALLTFTIKASKTWDVYS